MNHSFLEYFKCPGRYARFGVGGSLSATERYFRFGSGNVFYGHVGWSQNGCNAGPLSDAIQEMKFEDGIVKLPFDLNEVVNNLLRERYPLLERDEKSAAHSLAGAMYYYVRPLLPLGVRKH